MLVTHIHAARVAALLLLALLAMLAGCGQRGALYLPGQGPDVQSVIPETEAPATDEDADSEKASDAEESGQ